MEKIRSDGEVTSNGDSNEETEGDGKRKKLLRCSSDKSEQFILFGYLVVTIVIPDHLSRNQNTLYSPIFSSQVLALI